MTDKRSESERVSARPPVPSLAPPTDDIDSEWGSDDVPAPAPPQASAPPRASSPAPRPSSSPAAAIKTPVPRASSAPRPASSRPSATTTPLTAPSTRPSATETPVVKASTPPSAVTTPLVNPPPPGTPLVAASNPLRKQTLLGIAPVTPERTDPALSGGDSAASAPEAGLTVVASNPRRNQTLLGLAPVAARSPAPAADLAVEPPPSALAEPAATESVVAEAVSAHAAAKHDAPSVSSVSAPSVPATDAPTTSDVEDDPFKKADGRRAAALSSSHDDLPELKPKRSRWPLLLGLAAALALVIVGLRQLDHAPTPTPAELARPIAAKPAVPAAKALPSDDDDEGNLPTPKDTQPVPVPPEAKAEDAKAAASGSTPDAPATADSANKKSNGAAGGPTVRINVTSDPPGARLFWKGKEQGTTPFVLEFPAGERHSYEMGLPGYTVRKVVIDGTKTDINIGMKPEPAATSGAKPRK